MDGVQTLLAVIRDHNLAKGRLAGLFHLMIASKITDSAGTVISNGLTWRQLARELKDSRLDKHLVAEVGADPIQLSPRDRERFWYTAIGLGMANGQGLAQATHLTKLLVSHGYHAA